MRIIRTMDIREYELHRRKLRHSLVTRRILLTLTALLMLVLFTAAAEPVATGANALETASSHAPEAAADSHSPAVSGRVKIQQNTFALIDGQVVVEIEIDMRSVHVDPRSSVLLTPVLRAGSVSMDLPAIRINGDNQHKAWRRLEAMNKKDPATGMELHANSKKNPGPHLYRTSVPYEEWMEAAGFLLREDQCECSGPLMSLSMELLAGKLTGIKRTADTPYQPMLAASYIVPEVEAVKRRSESGKAYLDFEVGKSVILQNFKNNAAELQKIHNLISDTKADPNATITGIIIEGNASPEGMYASNLTLSERRAQALKSHIQTMYGFPGSMFTVKGKGEDWTTLDGLISQSEMDDKYRVLEIIRGTDVFDGRESKLMVLSAGKPYRQMKVDFFPQLRRSDYQLDYTVLPFTVDQGKEVFKTKPSSLSLNELFLIAGTYEPGSEAFNKVFETAARLFPQDDVANLNAAASALQRKDATSAARYMERVKGQSASYWNNLGILSWMQGEKEKAAECFDKAKQAGNTEAIGNSEELSKAM